ncbi:hypothetical protein BJX63DRAFT_425661 [Aspergillus granulosus]|uniref:Uncharacterized protein n=1 Tax=Aspergillus granulosus TaxID=176169 RepID=A0ABR4GV60_9EURO
MDFYNFTKTEFELAAERKQKYQGTVKIELEQIVPHSSCRKLNKKNVERLCSIFQKESCRRLDMGNQLTAVVRKQHLDIALRAAGMHRTELSKRDSTSYSRLQFAVGEVQYVSPGLQAALVDEYSNERTPSDGEVYCKVRQYQREANAEFEEMWMARLSGNKAKRFQNLSLNKSMRAAFDSFLGMPAILEQGMRFGSLPWVFAASADEEVISALAGLREFWSSLVQNKQESMLKIDAGTIERLQLRAPGVSEDDTKTVHGWISSGEAFPNFTESERIEIWSNLRERKTIIPSLYSFFQNMRYLAACANCMKRLVSFSKYHCTIKTAILSSFQPPGSCLIQTSETSFRELHASANECAELAYEQLWVYAMRHYSEMAKEPESDDVIAKPGRGRPNEIVLYNMARLARKLGFDSAEIQELLKLSPDRQIAKSALLKARPLDQFRYNADQFESLVDRIVDTFEHAAPATTRTQGLVLNQDTKLNARRGFPQQKANEHDRQFLFLDQLYERVPPCGKVTTFFVRQCVYFTFFGKISKGPLLAFSQPVCDIHQREASPLFIPEDPNRDEVIMSDFDTEPQRESENQEQQLQQRHGDYHQRRPVTKINFSQAFDNLEEEEHQREEQRLLAEQRRQREEQRLKEEERQREEQRLRDEEQRQREEERLREEERQREEQRVRDEEQRLAEQRQREEHQRAKENEERQKNKEYEKERQKRPITRVDFSQAFDKLDEIETSGEPPLPPDISTRKRPHMSMDEEGPNKRLKTFNPNEEFAFVVRQGEDFLVFKRFPLDQAQITSWAKEQSRTRGARFFDQGHRLVAPHKCYDTGLQDGTSTIEIKERPM